MEFWPPVYEPGGRRFDKPAGLSMQLIWRITFRDYREDLESDLEEAGEYSVLLNEVHNFIV